MTKTSCVDAASAPTPWIVARRITAEIFNGSWLDWMLIGSAASALQSASVEPGDLDIAVKSPEDLALTAELVPTAPEGEVPQEADPTWIRTQAAPILHMNTQAEQWTFPRWIIGGFRVEVAHIDSPKTTSLYLETRSPLSWQQREPLRCNGSGDPDGPHRGPARHDDGAAAERADCGNPGRDRPTETRSRTSMASESRTNEPRFQTWLCPPTSSE